jgi:hypothetical protein
VKLGSTLLAGAMRKAEGARSASASSSGVLGRLSGLADDEADHWMEVSASGTRHKRYRIRKDGRRWEGTMARMSGGAAAGRVQKKTGKTGQSLASARAEGGRRRRRIALARIDACRCWC